MLVYAERDRPVTNLTDKNRLQAAQQVRWDADKSGSARANNWRHFGNAIRYSMNTQKFDLLFHCM